MIGGTAASGLVGGLASVAGGGKFENGAVTAAFGYLFNNALSRARATATGMAYGGVGGAIFGTGAAVLTGGAGTVALPAEIGAGASVGGLIGWTVGAIADVLQGTWSDSVVYNEKTPTTHPDDFDRVRGTPAKVNPDTGEIWDPDRLHGNHWEVYGNKKAFEKGDRDRAVWDDGRLKEKF